MFIFYLSCWSKWGASWHIWTWGFWDMVGYQWVYVEVNLDMQLVIEASQPSLFSYMCSGSESCNSSWEVCSGLYLVCGYHLESDSHCWWLCQRRSVVSSYSDCHQQGWCPRVCSKDCFWGENNFSIHFQNQIGIKKTPHDLAGVHASPC